MKEGPPAGPGAPAYHSLLQEAQPGPLRCRLYQLYIYRPVFIVMRQNHALAFVALLLLLASDSALVSGQWFVGALWPPIGSGRSWAQNQPHPPLPRHLQGQANECEAGTYLPPGASDCSYCEEGYFQDEAGQTACKACPPGSFSDYGYFGDDKDISRCEKCSAGTYQPKAGQPSCLYPPKGRYVDAEGQTAYKTCPPGSYSNYGYYGDDKDISSCEKCSAGTYQPKAGQPSCLYPPEGRYVDAEGKTAYKTCPPGSYSNYGYYGYDKDISSCEKCSAGTYQPKAGQRTCLPCVGRQFSPQGSAKCIECKAGYIAGEKRDGCLSCPPGTYQSSNICGRCDYGEYQPKAAQTRCLKCKPGTASIFLGAPTDKSCLKYLPGAAHSPWQFPQGTPWRASPCIPSSYGRLIRWVGQTGLRWDVGSPPILNPCAGKIVYTEARTFDWASGPVYQSSTKVNSPPQSRAVGSGSINVPCNNYKFGSQTSECYSISAFVLPTRDILFIFDTHGASRHSNCTLPQGKSSVTCTIEDSTDCAMVTQYTSNCISRKEVATFTNIKFTPASGK